MKLWFYFIFKCHEWWLIKNYNNQIIVPHWKNHKRKIRHVWKDFNKKYNRKKFVCFFNVGKKKIKSHNFKIWRYSLWHTKAKWKVPKIVLYAHQGGQHPQQYPLFFFLLWEAQEQTQLLASTPKSNSITNG